MLAKVGAFFSEGSALASEGSETPSEASAFPSEASAFLAEASAQSSEGSDGPSEAGAHFSARSETPSEPSTFLAEASAFVAPCSAQGMAARPPPHPNAKRIASPAVRAKILAVIGRRLQPAERDDVAQKTYLRLLAIIETLPESDDDLIGLVGAVTHGQVIDQFRRNTVRDGRDAEEDAAAQVPESAEAVTAQQRLEWKKLYDVAEQAVRDGLIPPEGLTWSVRLARGDTYEEIAADEGLSAAAVRKRMERIRRILREHWKETTGLAGTVIGVVLLVLYLRQPRTPDIVPEAYVPAPSVSTAPAVETQDEKLGRLNRQAQEVCDRLNFDACEMVLDDAKAIDTRNEDRPEVIRMRRAIQSAHDKAPRLK